MKFFRFLGFKKKPKAPWSKYYKKEDMNLYIPDISLYDNFKRNMKKYPNNNAFDYFGKKTTYRELLREVDLCANSFLSYGIRKNDVVTICMPNTPEGVISFLALNKIGAISNMLHPLASENEIRDDLINTGSVMMVLIDMDYDKLKNVIEETDVYKIILVRPSDSMPFLTKVGYNLSIGLKTKLPKNNSKYVYWDQFMNSGKDYKSDYHFLGRKNSPAVMLHSGGSTGSPKAIVLSNGNFIALTEQAKIVFDELEVGDKCLSIMPIFHGFGLGVCVYTPLCVGAECILIPQFKAQEFDKILMKHRPEFVIGVPTLFEAMMKSERQDRIKLNYIKYIISGGDTLSLSLEKRINKYLSEHGASTRIVQGYGMSECLAAVCLGFKNILEYGSIGIPFPGCYIGIFNESDIEVPYGSEGEICISGPNVMLGYYNNEKETNGALHIHDDGNVWLHSGDLGVMDKNGFIKYTGRLKRLIVTSGYNVYPVQIEEVLEKHPAVMLSSVVGIPHPYKQEVPKAFIVLNKGYRETEELVKELKELCSKNLPRYAKVYEYEFRKSLPRTMVGKVDFRKLQEENNKLRREEREKEKV